MTTDEKSAPDADLSMYRDAPRARYVRDPAFRQLVDHMWAMIERAQFSPSELREAAILAAIKYEERKVTNYIVFADGRLEPGR